MTGKRIDHDRAHGCFLLCGLGALIIGVLSLIPMGDGAAGVLGILFAVPLFLASLAALIIGVVLTVRLWPDRLLLIQVILACLFLAEFLAEFGSVAFYNAVPVAYGIAVIVVSGTWFLFVRGRRFPRS